MISFFTDCWTWWNTMLDKDITCDVCKEWCQWCKCGCECCDDTYEYTTTDY